MIFKTHLFFLAALSFTVSFPANADTVWSVQQITDNNFADKEPVLSDTRVSWLGRAGNTVDVYVYDGSSISRLTDNNFNEQNLFASEKYFAWNLRNFTNDPIFLYDGNSVEQLTSTGVHYRPKIYGEKMVWGRSSNDVILYDIASDTSSQLIAPGGSGNEIDPSIYGNWVSFTSNEGDSEIYYYDIANDLTHKLTDNGLSEHGSSINDDYITYTRYDGSDNEVFIYNRSTMVTSQLTDNLGNDGSLVLSGHDLIWTLAGDSFNNYKLYHHKASTGVTYLVAENLSRNGDIPPSIDGNRIVYSGWDGNDWEIYTYEIDTNTTTRLTDNLYEDIEPTIRENRIVWVHLDGPDDDNGDYEIMLATGAEEPVIALGTNVGVIMDEDANPVAFDLTLDASDADSDILTWSISSDASKGTASASGTGLSKVINYTPNQDENGIDSFDVQVSDGVLTDTITVNVTINAINDPPIFNRPTIAFLDGEALVGQVKISDAENDTVTFLLIGGVDQALFDLTADGQLSFKTAPDIKDPMDEDKDNRYEIIIQIFDGFDTTEQAITVLLDGCTFFVIPANGRMAVICL